MGGKRITIEYIREQFAKEGYELLSGVYINAQTKLKYRCPEGHKHNITWNMWQQGHRCSYCVIHRIACRNRNTLEYVNSGFEKENYKLLTTEYVNNKQKLECICDNGHKCFITWNNWQRGCRCPFCYGNVKLTIEFIRYGFEKENYILLTEEYTNSKQKLEYICPNGHIHKINWSMWNSGSRCPFCHYIGMQGSGNCNWKNYSKEDLQKLSIYKEHVWQLTNCNYRKYKFIINPLNLPRKRKKYSLDHIYSISDGFRDSVPAEILASPVNLQMMLYYENIIKRSRSDISLNELYINYNKELNNEL